MEYRKLQYPNLKVIEFKYPTQNLNKYDDLTSEFSEYLQSIVELLECLAVQLVLKILKTLEYLLIKI